MGLVDFVIMTRKNSDEFDSDEGLLSKILPINDMSNLQRTINMFSKFGNISVVCQPSFQDKLFDRKTVDKMFTLNGDINSDLYGVHIIYKYKFSASDRVVFLRGNVIFSTYMRDIIVKDKETFPTVYGRNETVETQDSSLFAISVGNEWFSFFSSATFGVWQKKQAIGKDATWEDLVYTYDLPVVSTSGDYTNSINSVDEYMEYYPTLKRYAEKDIDK